MLGNWFVIYTFSDVYLNEKEIVWHSKNYTIYQSEMVSIIIERNSTLVNSYLAAITAHSSKNLHISPLILQIYPKHNVNVSYHAQHISHRKHIY